MSFLLTVPKSAAVFVLEILNAGLRRVTGALHRLQMAIQWGIPPQPEWFDHYLDQYWQWRARESSFWVERGVFARMLLKPNARLLEICCGDGFNSRHFYASAASQVIALDFDRAAIRHAKRFNSHPKITFFEQDIRKGLPEGPFDNVVWDAAIEHFTTDEVAKIMSGITARLGEDGVLGGYTLAEADDGHKHLDHHEQEFSTTDDVRRLLAPYFKHVRVWETKHSQRHNLYFACSQKPMKILGEL